MNIIRDLVLASVLLTSSLYAVAVTKKIRFIKHLKGFSKRGKYAMGWFFGFKLRLIINDKGEILNFMFTHGNVDDREPLKQDKFVSLDIVPSVFP